MQAQELGVHFYQQQLVEQQISNQLCRETQCLGTFISMYILLFDDPQYFYPFIYMFVIFTFDNQFTGIRTVLRG